MAFWEEPARGLAASVAPVAPPAASRIEAALIAPRRISGGGEGLWRSLAFWRGLAIAASAFAVACLAGLIYVAQAPTLRPPLVAKLDE